MSSLSGRARDDEDGVKGNGKTVTWCEGVQRQQWDGRGAAEMVKKNAREGKKKKREKGKNKNKQGTERRKNTLASWMVAAAVDGGARESARGRTPAQKYARKENVWRGAAVRIPRFLRGKTRPLY